MLTQKRLKEVLDYDRTTGIFRWRKRISIRITVGSEAGQRNRGYVLINIDGKRYRAHRLAWLYVTGSFPRYEIDHINGIRDENRFCNLRDVPRLINGQNHRKADCDSKTGFLGVTKRKNGFVAQISTKGKNFNLGIFPSAEKAHKAYIKAKRQIHIGGTL